MWVWNHHVGAQLPMGCGQAEPNPPSNGKAAPAAQWVEHGLGRVRALHEERGDAAPRQRPRMVGGMMTEAEV